jgi:plasmid stabilization system protein ParE
MKVEYSNRATSDLRKIAADSRRIFGEKVAAELGLRIEEIVERIRRTPESAPRVDQRSGVRVVLLIRYPIRYCTEFSRTGSYTSYSPYVAAPVVTRELTGNTRRTNSVQDHDY